MPTRYIVALFATLGRAILAQPSAVEPLGTFELQLEQRAGRAGSIAFFVARNSHLYFVVSGANGWLAFRTDAEGIVQSTGSLGAEPISAFDSDGDGNSFLLRGNSQLTEFDGAWNIKKELSLQAPIMSFALVEGRPMGVGANSRVAYLDTHEGVFQLEAYPPPWVLFTVGRNRLGVLRPQEPSVFLGGDDETSVTFLDADISARKPFAAAAGPDDKLYLLASPDHAGSASVIECDDHTSPNFIFDLALPESFHPRMIGITGGRIYLADPAGKVAFYLLDPEPSAGQAIDSGPALLSDMEPVREAALRKAAPVKLMSTWR
jgi:hypothetical protein